MADAIKTTLQSHAEAQAHAQAGRAKAAYWGIEDMAPCSTKSCISTYSVHVILRRAMHATSSLPNEICIDRHEEGSDTHGVHEEFQAALG